MDIWLFIPIAILWTLIGSLCVGKMLQSPVCPIYLVNEDGKVNAFSIGMEIWFVMIFWPVYIVFKFIKS